MPKLPNPSRAVVNVGVAATKLADVDDDRKSLVIVNISDETVWISTQPTVAPTVGNGEPIYPGCAVNITPEILTEAEINGICTSGGKNVLVLTDYPPVALASSVLTLGAGGALIGSVRLQDGDGSTLADVKQADGATATTDKVLAVQPIDQKGKVLVGGGGGAGGGNMVYLSPEDFTATYLAGTQLTLAGLSFVPAIQQFKRVVQVKADGSRETYQATDYVFAYAAGVLTVTGAAFVNTDLGYEVMLFGPDKAFNQAQDAAENLILNWPEDRNLHLIHEDTTNLAGPAAYPYPGAAGFAMQGYRAGSLQYKLDDVTLEVFGRNHADLDWERITHLALDSRTGGAAAAVIGGAGLAMQGILFFDDLNVDIIYVEINTFDGGNAVELDWRNRA